MSFSFPSKFRSLLLILLCVVTFASVRTYAQDVALLPVPNPPRLLVDKANILIPEQAEILENKLVAFDDSTSNQISVVIIPTLNGYPIEEYATKLFRSWGIGGKKNNNGVLLLIAASDKKIKIEVGYGLEGAITDVQSKSIIENDLAPNFRQENYYRGIDQAINSLEKAAAGEYKVARDRSDDSGGSAVVFFIILAIVIFIVIASKGGKGGGGGVASRGGWSNIILPMILGSAMGRGSSGGFGGGGFGGGGGGFGGGGFGGFGGGSSGGGGASGGW